jgi:predicted TIM-barrel fold metal-dependent hydrolase
MKVIDVHTHCFSDELAVKAIPILAKRAKTKPYCDGTINCLRESMKKSGIDISVVQTIATKAQQTRTINKWASEIQSEDIIAFGTIHPDYKEWKEEIEYLKNNKIRGVKFHPDYQNFCVDEKSMYPIYEKLFSEGMIVLFHSGVDIGLPAPYHCTPENLSKVIDAFPQGNIIAAHMGGHKYWDEVQKYLIGKNVYFDTSYSFRYLGIEVMEKMIKNHGADKILFGTDSPWGEQLKELNYIRRLNIPKPDKDLILGINFERLLQKSKQGNIRT